MHVTCALIGLVIAVAVSLLHSATSGLNSWRIDTLLAARSAGGLWASWGCLIAISWTMGLVAYSCVLFVPHSRGSGLPQLIAYLNGIKIDGFTWDP